MTRSTINWLDGTYTGELLDNVPEGDGKIIMASGTTYEGNWVKGQPYGKGRMVYSNGDIYEGEFKAGKRHGDGKYITNNGKVVIGEWSANNFIKKQECIEFPVSNTDNKECPFCKELIKQNAVKCKHCGEYLDKKTTITHDQHATSNSGEQASPIGRM